MPGEPLRFIDIGVILGAVGVAGEARAVILSDFPKRFEELRSVRVGERLRAYVVESSRLLRGEAVLKLQGVDNANAVDELRGSHLRVPIAEAVQLDSDSHYWHEVIGLRVVTTDGTFLGRVSDILRTGANDVYVVRYEGPAHPEVPDPVGSSSQGKSAGKPGELLLPAIEDVVRKIDVAAGEMVVSLLPGMLPGED